MSGVLHDRIIEAVLFSAVCQYLCPIFLMLVAENPPAVILDFENNYTDPGCHGQIYLSKLTVRLPNIKVMKDGSWVDSLFK